MDIAPKGNREVELPAGPLPARRAAALRRSSRTAVVVVLLIAVGVAALALASRPRVAGADASSSTPDQATVTVSATGSVPVTPDVLRLGLGAEVSAPRAGLALASASAAAARIAAALRAAGVAAADVQTTGLSVSPRYGTRGAVSGYTARQQVSATVRDLGRAGATVDAASIAAGAALRVDSLVYAVEDEGAVQTAARQAAYALARSRAQTYATAAGRQLGALLQVGEGGQQFPSSDGSYSAAASSAPVAPGFDAGSLQPGSVRVAVTLTARFALR